jgi:hypothetical protein
MRTNKKNLYIIYLLTFVFALSGSVLFNGCNRKPADDNVYKLTGDTIKDGEYLVNSKCKSCHQLVQPGQLSKAVWLNHTLPAMAKYLHISTYGGTQYFKNNPLDTTGITLTNWQAIVSYYKKVAPDQLAPAKPPVPLLNDWAGFSLKKPAKIGVPVFTTMAAYNPGDHKIYSSDGSTERLYGWDNNLKPKSIMDMPSPVIDAKFIKNSDGTYQDIFTCIGRLLPMDFPNGRVVSMTNTTTVPNPPQVIASELARPVETISADFNKDGLTDFVVCSQGDKAGGVYLMTQKADHSYVQSNISNRAGAVQAIAGDFNNDGWQDIMILFGSGDEGLWMFLNNQKGGFTSKNLLRFPPVYGSSSFQLVDIDHDGKLDVVYTSGYNYHDSRILKPYNGLYIFKNDGNWALKQTYFYPINGCTKAIATDFDGDGDADIATIAFFADMQGNPAEEFIYFEQNGPMSFKPHAVPVSKEGRWFSMDVNDINNDGKPDIILGNFSSKYTIQPNLKPFWDQNTPFIILENHTKK